MKNVIVFIVGILLLSSCKDEDVISQNFNPYLDKFVNECAIRGIDYNANNKQIVIEFVKDLRHEPSNNLRVAGLGGSNKDKIYMYFDIDSWHSKSDSDREVLFLHEAGHAFFGYDHDLNIIMKTNAVKYDLYKSNRTEMLNEFFGTPNFN